MSLTRILSIAVNVQYARKQSTILMPDSVAHAEGLFIGVIAEVGLMLSICVMNAFRRIKMNDAILDFAEWLTELLEKNDD